MTSLPLLIHFSSFLFWFKNFQNRKTRCLSCSWVMFMVCCGSTDHHGVWLGKNSGALTILNAIPQHKVLKQGEVQIVFITEGGMKWRYFTVAFIATAKFLNETKRKQRLSSVTSSWVVFQGKIKQGKPKWTFISDLL